MNGYHMNKKYDSGSAGTATTRSDGAGPDAGGIRLELWTRRPVSGRRTDVIDRLSALKSSGAIGEFIVETWPDEVFLSEHAQGARVLGVYEEFRTWADERDVTITPPFERRTVTSLVGRTEAVLTVPVLCLAVYADGLSGVFPCQDGDRTLTVTEFLDAFERADGATDDALELVRAAAD